MKAHVTQVQVAVPISKAPSLSRDLVNRQTGEVLLEANKPLTAEIWAALAEAGITDVDVFFPDRDDVGVVL